MFPLVATARPKHWQLGNVSRYAPMDAVTKRNTFTGDYPTPKGFGLISRVNLPAS